MSDSPAKAPEGMPPDTQPQDNATGTAPIHAPVKRSLVRRAGSFAKRTVRRTRHYFTFRRRYLGFRMPYFHSPAYDRLPDSAFWEPELTAAMLQQLDRSGKDSPVVFDIGANAGFVTLNVLSKFPRARVFAFEPGPGQRKVLERIVRRNMLQTVTIVPIALGTEAGTATFVTHSGVDASGLDGFRDTGSCSGGQTITVPVQTLDQWWQDAGRPAPDLIKIDTEGSELFVLRGAEELVRSFKPILALEIWPSHVACYPYTLQDLLDWIHSQGYGLFTFDGRRVAAVDTPQAFGHEMNFLARPVAGG